MGNERASATAARQFLLIQLFGIVFFAATIPLSAVLAERGRRATLIWVTVGDRRVRTRARADACRRAIGGATLAMVVGLSLMGLTYGPLGTALSELFPTAVRYTGSSLTFNLAGIFGASLGAVRSRPTSRRLTACSTSVTT